MARVEQSHFYDEQIRRYILQFIRIFSGFSVKTGKENERWYIRLLHQSSCTLW